MVNIIINEVKEGKKEVESMQWCDKFVPKEDSQSQLIDMILELKEENKVTHELLNQVLDKLDSLSKVNTTNNAPVKDAKKVMIDAIEGLDKIDKSVKPNNDKNKTKKSRRKRKRLQDADTYYPLKHTCNLWKNLELLDDGKIIARQHKDYILPVDINELLYIIECDASLMTLKTFKSLINKYNSNNNTFSKLIYNIREGNFKPILEEYYSKLNKTEFTINEGLLKINNLQTFISRDTAYDWIQIMFNTDKKQKTIINIQESYSQFDPYQVRVICESYNNNELLNLLKPEETSFIENNPSKRRNMIRNGGLL